ncbi:Sodium-dependent serotonin transporter [Mactra antiquata]
MKDIDIELKSHTDDDDTELSTILDADERDGLSNTSKDIRGVWTNKREFFLAIVGYTVGVGSVWRFPIICSRNGGGAFLIPFFFFLITCGGPLYYMEVCIGQFSGKSAGLAFEFCPLFKAIASVMEGDTSKVTPNISTLYNSTTNSTNMFTDGIIYNHTVSRDMNQTVLSQHFRSSALEFWEYEVIRKSSGLEEMGSVQLHMVICLFIAWFFCVAAVIKGVKVLGKVVYVTALAPYVLLTVLLIQGLTLDGAMDGIKTYLTPDFSKLLTSQVWLDAAIQVFFSLGPSWGSVITMSSYNKFHQKTFWSTTLCVATAGFTAFYNGLVVFTLLGFTAKSSGKTVTEVASESGPGLMFVVFPTALSMMPVPQIWSVLFFLTMVTVAFDSEFGMLETVTSCSIDMFPHRLLNRRQLVNIVTGLCFFILGIPLTMNGGIYLFELADWYLSSFALLTGSFLECVAVCWIYGTDRFTEDIIMMTGRESSVVLRFLWSIFIPVSVVIVFILTLTQFSVPIRNDGYTFSSEAITLGICGGLIPVIVMLAMMIVSLVKEEGTLIQRFKSSLKPSTKWIPKDPTVEDLLSRKPYTYPDSMYKRFGLNIRGKKDTPIF